MSRQAVGVYGYLCLLAWAIVVPSLVPGPRVYPVLGTVGLLSWLLGTRGWRSLGSRRTWLFVGGLVGLGALARGWSGAAPAVQAGLELGLQMGARALAILLAADALAAHVSPGELAALLEGLGLPGLGFSLGVAFNTLPTLRRTAGNVLAALRQRGGPWRRPWQAWPRTAVTILALTLARGQETVDAAEARAFSPGRAPAVRPRWRRADALLALGLAGWGLLLALV